MSDTDERFLRYPALPVDACDGYAKEGADDPKRG
jgi:hypothetical protein